jgi:hypothetical protein
LRGLSYIGGLKAIKAGKTALLCAKILPFRRVVAGLLQQRFSGFQTGVSSTGLVMAKV